MITVPADGDSRRALPRCFAFRAFALSLVALLLAPSLGAEAGKGDQYNIGFFPYMFGGAPESDARAAFRYWVQVMGEESNVAVNSTSRVFKDPADVVQATREGSIDIVAFSSVDYLAIRDQLPPGSILSPIRSGKQTEDYIVVVHVDSPIRHLADLKGRTLLRIPVSSSLLAMVWLEAELHTAGLPVSAHHLGEVRTMPKPAKAVLPVFFRQADACLTTRRSFEMLCELNPQVNKQLRIIAASPPLVSSLIWVALPPGSSLHVRALNAIRNLQNTTTGLQTLLMFQFDRVQDCPDAALDSTRQLLRRLPPDLKDASELMRVR